LTLQIAIVINVSNEIGAYLLLEFVMDGQRKLLEQMLSKGRFAF